MTTQLTRRIAADMVALYAELTDEQLGAETDCTAEQRALAQDLIEMEEALKLAQEMVVRRDAEYASLSKTADVFMRENEVLTPKIARLEAGARGILPGLGPVSLNLSDTIQAGAFWVNRSWWEGATNPLSPGEIVTVLANQPMGTEAADPNPPEEVRVSPAADAEQGGGS